MDTFGIPDRLCEMDDACSFQELSDDDVFSAPRQEDYDGLAADWLDSFTVLDQDDPVLNDRMMSEAARSPRVHSEHSYSMTGGVSSVALDDAAAADEGEEAAAGSDVPNRRAPTADCPLVAVKTEPLVVEARRAGQQLSLLRPQPSVTPAAAAMVVLTAAAAAAAQQRKQPKAATAAVVTKSAAADGACQMVTTVNIKLEPGLESPAAPVSPLNSASESMDCFSDSLPPTPPSSSASGDSDGGGSGGGSTRKRSAASLSRSPSPIVEVVHITSSNGSNCGGGSALVQHKAGRSVGLSAATAPYSQPIPTSGVLILTEEEKRTLVSEGYSVPTRLPLTKQEERNLKKVRRKIKNKISAQESRRKKKEYVDTLEKRVEDLSRDNADLRRKCDTFQSSNRSLLEQLQRLQAVVKGALPSLPSPLRSPSAAQASTCLAVLVMCFAVFIGGWAPSNLSFGSSTNVIRWHQQPLGGPDAYATPSMRSSRTLMHVSDDSSLDDDLVGGSKLLPLCWNSLTEFISRVAWTSSGADNHQHPSGSVAVDRSSAAAAAVASLRLELSQEPSMGGRSSADLAISEVILSPVGSLSRGESRPENITN